MGSFSFYEGLLGHILRAELMQDTGYAKGCLIIISSIVLIPAIIAIIILVTVFIPMWVKMFANYQRPTQNFYGDYFYVHYGGSDKDSCIYLSLLRDGIFEESQIKNHKIIRKIEGRYNKDNHTLRFNQFMGDLDFEGIGNEEYFPDSRSIYYNVDGKLAIDAPEDPDSGIQFIKVDKQSDTSLCNIAHKK